jgi:hypothetical protein
MQIIKYNEYSMKWIEVIDLRSTGNDQKTLKHMLKTLTKNNQKSGLKIILYHNTPVESDISIHLQWEDKERTPEKSDLGLHLALALEEFGRVNHSIWIEDEGGKK